IAPAPVWPALGPSTCTHRAHAAMPLELKSPHPVGRVKKCRAQPDNRSPNRFFEWTGSEKYTHCQPTTGAIAHEIAFERKRPDAGRKGGVGRNADRHRQC